MINEAIINEDMTAFYHPAKPLVTVNELYLFLNLKSGGQNFQNDDEPKVCYKYLNCSTVSHDEGASL